MSQKQLESILRVNQAGEWGACQIYKGQMAVLGHTPELCHLYNQEKDHCQAFTRLMIEHQIQPTLFQPLWHIFGWALGAGSALLGERYAHACTIAVEEVIEVHYQQQLDSLPSLATDLKKLIDRCQQEEREHKKIAIQNKGSTVPGYKVFSAIIKTATHVAITLSKRI